jgi:hypothetical protein
MTDIGGWETGILAVFVVFIFGLGIFPVPVSRLLEPALTQSLGDSSGTPIARKSHRDGSGGQQRRHRRHRTASAQPTPAPEGAR